MMKATENRHFRSLELDKILEMLASHATCADAKELALSLTPQTDLYLAQALLKQTEDAHMLLARFGGPSFGGLHNVNNALQRAAAGGMLTMRELLRQFLSGAYAEQIPGRTHFKRDPLRG